MATESTRPKIQTSRPSWLRYCEATLAYDQVLKASVTFMQPAELPEIEVSDDDIDYMVNAGDRSDKLAYKFYGDPALWWVIALRNQIDLPEVGLWKGRVIVIPSPQVVREKLAK